MNQTKSTIRIATRDSLLALVQTFDFAQKIASPHTASIRSSKTLGDKKLSEPLYDLKAKEGKAYFTKELEDQMLTDEADIAVHSLKDVPTSLPSGLEMGFMGMVASPNDIVISKKEISSLAGLTVGTSSLRRIALIKSYFSNCKIELLRGNVLTRIEKLFKSESLDCIILAKAGLSRLIHFRHGDRINDLELSKKVRTELSRFDRIKKLPLHYYELPVDEFLPAVAQGVIGIEQRRKFQIQQYIDLKEDKLLNDSLMITRKVLTTLQAGCHIPLGIHAKHNGKQFEVRAFFAPGFDPDSTSNDLQKIQIKRRISNANSTEFNCFINELKQEKINIAYTGSNFSKFEKNLDDRFIKSHHPLTKIQPIDFDRSILEKKFSAIAITSQSIVKDLEDLNTNMIFAVGPQTAKVCAERFANHVKKIITADKYTARGLGERVIAEKVDGPILWLGAKGGVKDGIDLLKYQQKDVTVVEPYESVQQKTMNFPLESMVVFTSPSTVHSYCDQNLFSEDHAFVCLGPTTASSLVQYQKYPYLVASNSEIATLVDELNSNFKPKNLHLRLWRPYEKG